jgi:hypothetical protein
VQLARARGRFRGRRLLHEGVEVDADGEIAHARAASAGKHLDHLAAALESGALDQRAHALQEIAPVTRGLKAEEIVMQQRLDQSHAPRQLEIDVGRWKRDVQEEADAGVAAQPTQFGGDVHQMVVVHPDEVVVRARRVHYLRIFAVDLAIGAPVGGVEIAQQLHVVEQRPDHLVGEALVEVAYLLGRERHGLQRVTRRAAHRVQLGVELGVALRDPGPPDPDPAAVPQHRQQRRNQPAPSGVGAPAAVVIAPERERQAVRHHDQAVVAPGHRGSSVSAQASILLPPAERRFCASGR